MPRAACGLGKRPRRGWPVGGSGWMLVSPGLAGFGIRPAQSGAAPTMPGPAQTGLPGRGMGLVQRQASERSPVPQSRSVRLARNALLAPFLIGLVLLAFLGSAFYAMADEPSWVEPRALNIVDIAGQVPDWVLEDNIVAFSHIGGLAQFVWSEREGDLLRIGVRLHPRTYPSGDAWTTAFTLLGHRAILDHMGSSVPEMWVRLYDGQAERPVGFFDLATGRMVGYWPE